MPEDSNTRKFLTPDFASALVDLDRPPDLATKNLQDTFALITERAAETLGAARANIWLFTDTARSSLRCIDCFDLNRGIHSADLTLNAEAFPVYIEALKHERVIIADDALHDPRTRELAAKYLDSHNISSMLDAPIRQDGEVVGVVCLEHVGRLRQWTEQEAAFVATLSDFATIALISHHKDIVEKALVEAQKMESLGRLAGGIAHDFNNILTIITGAVETLQHHYPADADEDRLLNLITDAGERGRKLTRNLLACGARQVLKFAPLSSHVLLDGVQALTYRIIRDDIEIDFDKGAAEYWLTGDRDQLEQVLFNLMVNSIDAMPDGGKLKVAVLPPDPHERIGITITDTGGGIPEKIQQRIFDPFFTTKGGVGSGLGLSISLGIVQQHDGTLRCAASNAQGTSFEIRLPLDTGTGVTAPASTHAAESFATTGQRVLLVEDEPGVREIVTQMLGVIGYETVVADDATHALRLLQEQRVDLLITDVVMPDMKGPDLYREVLRLRPEQSVLFVSGYSEDVISEVPTGDNRVGYLSKPFTLRQLRNAVTNLINDAAEDA